MRGHKIGQEEMLGFGMDISLEFLIVFWQVSTEDLIIFLVILTIFSHFLAQFQLFI